MPTLKILAIETSCDDTAVSVVEIETQEGSQLPIFNSLSHIVSSQTEIHQAWGGVVPNLAKREHAKNIVPVILTALDKAGLTTEKKEAGSPIDQNKKDKINTLLEKNENLSEIFWSHIPTLAPQIDAIAVTTGPGLEPALWVGISVAESLAILWGKPLVPVNHIEGHIVSPLIENPEAKLPALALIVSGGHTELIFIEKWGSYKKIGTTRDDACGEAFDKVGRLLDLPYPGGPEIGRLAKMAEDRKDPKEWSLPRPMIDSPDYDFSFSGLKTAVRYTIERQKKLSTVQKEGLALEFEQAVVDVLVSKTKKALTHFPASTLIVGGGVASNLRLRQAMNKMISENFSPTLLLFPPQNMTTDNATMIGVVAGLKISQNFDLSPILDSNIVAKGNLSI